MSQREAPKLTPDEVFTELQQNLVLEALFAMLEVKKGVLDQINAQIVLVGRRPAFEQEDLGLPAVATLIRWLGGDPGTDDEGQTIQ